MFWLTVLLHIPMETSPPNLSVIVAERDYSKSYSTPDLRIKVLNQGGSEATIAKVFLLQTGSGGGYYYPSSPVTIYPLSTAWVTVLLDFDPPTPGYFGYTGPMACQLMDSSGNVLYSTNDLKYN